MRKFCLRFATLAVAAVVTAGAARAVTLSCSPMRDAPAPAIANPRLAGLWRIEIWGFGSCRAVLNRNGVVTRAVCSSLGNRLGLALGSTFRVSNGCVVSGALELYDQTNPFAVKVKGALSQPISATAASTVIGSVTLSTGTNVGLTMMQAR